MIEYKREESFRREAIMNKQKKTVVIGLDCADPGLVFNEFRDDLPNLSWLMEKGTYGKLRSTTPPITVPAWMSMVTGKDPGELGLYGFQNRAEYAYGSLMIPNSRHIKDPTVWETLTKRGFKSIVLGVPLTYPPKPLNGCMVTSFLTPSIQSPYTYPPGLKDEIHKLVGDYRFDVDNLRIPDKQKIIDEVYEMTDKRFLLAEKFLREKDWDFFMMVEMGTDRMHHALWAHHDKTHFKHDPASPFKEAIHNYYKHVDEKLGTLFKALPEGTRIMIVSDHGVQKMKGGLAINDWLIENGYLVLKEDVSKPTRIEKLIIENKIDWSRTTAWVLGGYYGKLYINLKGREEKGIVRPGYFEAVRNRLVKEIKAIHEEDFITGEKKKMNTRIFKPEAIYKEAQNIPPDLMIYFGNLSWRAIGTVGNGSIWVHENDTGPDDANHAEDGIIISTEKECPASIMAVRDYILSFY